MLIEELKNSEEETSNGKVEKRKLEKLIDSADTLLNKDEKRPLLFEKYLV
jgi:hypothetical protein